LQTPTVRRRWLASELRRLREAASLTCEEVAEKLECSASKISRMETGRVSASPLDVRDLLEIYGASPAQRKQLVQLARDSRQKGWWDSFKDAIEPHFATYLGLESAAAEIRTYEVGLIPGLLQTEEYARAAISIGMLTSLRGNLDRLVELAMARQPTLTTDHPPQFWAVLDEAALRRQVGGPAVMGRQLEHLLEMARLPHVQIQLIPFSGGAHPAIGRSFVILSFADGSAPEVVYLEDLTSARYLEDAAEVDCYNASFNHLRAAALPLTDSAALIADALNGRTPAAGAAARAGAPRLAELATAARRARAKSQALHAQNAVIAEALAETQDSIAGVLDSLAKRSPDDERLQAKSAAARRRAARQRQRAADIRFGRPR
jgi:transcriptional regulator with XRE-family HTH domain